MTSEIIYRGNLRTEATHHLSGQRITTDAPPDNNGLGQAFSPTDLVATALGSCMLTIMGMRAAEMENVQLAGTRVEVEKIMAPNPRRIAGINLIFHFPESLKVSGVQKTILEKAAHTCPVHYSLHPDTQINIRFGWPGLANG